MPHLLKKTDSAAAAIALEIMPAIGNEIHIFAASDAEAKSKAKGGTKTKLEAKSKLAENFLSVDCKSAPTADGKNMNGNEAAVHLSAAVPASTSELSDVKIFSSARGAS